MFVTVRCIYQVPHLDAIVVPVSGGGMISGITVAAKGINPNIKVVAAEPVGVGGHGADVAASKARSLSLFPPIATLRRPSVRRVPGLCACRLASLRLMRATVQSLYF